MTKRFHYDYFSLRDVNVEKWSQDFFWPVSRETTTQIMLDFKAEQTRLINELGYTFEGDCFLIGHLISTEFVRVVNHYLIVHRLLMDNFELVLSEKLELIPKFLSNKRIDFSYQPLNIGIYRSYVEAWLRYAWIELKYNLSRGNYSCYQHQHRHNPVYSFCSPNVIDRDYTRRLQNWVRITFRNEWLCGENSIKLSTKRIQKFRDIARAFLSFTTDYTNRNFGIDLPQNIKDALFAYTTDYLEHIGGFYEVIRKKVTKICPRHLLTPTAGQPFVRALSLAVRNEGGRVTGFPHGYYICHYSSPRQALHEMATVDEFMAYSPGSVPLIHRNLSQNPPPRNNPVKILHENNPVLLEQWNSWKNKPLPKKIETVMVLELSLRTELAGYYVTDSMVNYHFYYRLCRFLSDKGYKIIFKKRPKSQKWDGINLFRDIRNMEVVNDRFEEPGVVDKADAIFVQYAMSSTLYWSMCTNKTVIYLDAGWEPWFSDVYELMAKRCKILHCWYDERNRQCFDEEELLNILETPPEPPNTEFLEKYLFPN